MKRFMLIEGELVEHELGDLVLYSDYEKLKRKSEQQASDAGWAADAAREQAEINRFGNEQW